MAEIMLARGRGSLTDAEREVMRRALFGLVDGVDDAARKAWRRFWSAAMKRAPGECFAVETRFPRNPKFHRKFFALLNLGFEAWDPPRKRRMHKGQPIAKSFDAFREDITILAGYYEQTFDLRGRMRLRAKSISFAKMSDEEFEGLYSAVVDVLLSHVLVKYANRAQVDSVVDELMRFAQ